MFVKIKKSYPSKSYWTYKRCPKKPLSRSPRVNLLSEQVGWVRLWSWIDNASSEKCSNGPVDRLHSLVSFESLIDQYDEKHKSMYLFAITLHAPQWWSKCTGRFKNFRDNGFQKSRKYLASLESFYIRVRNVYHFSRKFLACRLLYIWPIWR